MFKCLKSPKVVVGFSLIEVLIAMVIMSVGLISLAKFQANVIRSNTVAKERTKAVTLAQNNIEQFRGNVVSETAFDNLVAGIAVNETRTTQLPDIQDDTANYSLTQDITKLDNGDVELKMTVSWPDLHKGDGTASEKTKIYLTSVVSQQAIVGEPTKVVLKPGALTATTTTSTTTTTTSASTTTTSASTTTTSASTTTTSATTTTTSATTTTTSATTTTTSTTTTSTTTTSTTTTTTKKTTTTTTTTTTACGGGGMMGGMMGGGCGGGMMGM